MKHEKSQTAKEISIKDTDQRILKFKTNTCEMGGLDVPMLNAEIRDYEP